MTIMRMRQLEALGLSDLAIEIVGRVDRLRGTGADLRPYTFDLVRTHEAEDVTAAEKQAAAFERGAL